MKCVTFPARSLQTSASLRRAGLFRNDTGRLRNGVMKRCIRQWIRANIYYYSHPTGTVQRIAALYHCQQIVHVT